jgi:acyl carrier protein
MAITRNDVLAAIDSARVLEDVSIVRDDISLTEQGIDSLGMFNVLLVVEERFGIKIPDSDVEGLETVNDLVRYVNTRIQ